MTKTPITLQDLRRRLYVKAKAEPSWRFWGLYTHVCKRETLRAAYELAKQNDGAQGTDGVTFEAIEVDGVERFLDQLREELVQRSYRPQRPRKVGIPKEGGKVRQLSIPSIRDRVAQGALKLILEPIWRRRSLVLSGGRMSNTPGLPMTWWSWWTDIRASAGFVRRSNGDFERNWRRSRSR